MKSPPLRKAVHAKSEPHTHNQECLRKERRATLKQSVLKICGVVSEEKLKACCKNSKPNWIKFVL